MEGEGGLRLGAKERELEIVLNKILWQKYSSVYK